MSRIYDGELETKSFCGSDLGSVLSSSAEPWSEFVSWIRFRLKREGWKHRMRQHNGLRVC